MSLPLHLPLDYEQLPELWQLKSCLQSANDQTAAHNPASRQSPKQIECAASWIFNRLFVALGYQARSTNRPGFLSQAGAMQFRATFDPYFGDDCNVVGLLEKSGLLKAVDGGWICELFARENPHLAGDFKPPHLTGNVNSRFSASYKRIEGEAWQQTKMLLPGIFKRHDGTPMTGGDECAACIVLIRAIDRAINKPGDHTSNSAFSDGLIAAASRVTAARKPADLMPFYFWLANHFEHPMIPKSSEEIIADFDKYFALMSR